MEHIFPTQTNWRWRHTILTTEALAAGESKVIFYEKPLKGWVVCSIFATSSADVEYNWELYDAHNRIFKPSFSASLLNTYGFDSPMGGSILPWVAKYQAMPPVYVMAFGPTFPGLPFSGQLKVVAYNPDSSAQTLYLVVLTLIELLE